MLSRFFIYRPIFACVISVVIIIAGGISIPILPIEQTPDITPPTVTVSGTYPGSSADVVTDTVVAPLEEQINGVQDMIYMSSSSSNNGSFEIIITFRIGTDVDMATVLVQNRVAQAEPTLPEEVKRQGVVTEKKSTNITLMPCLVSPNGTYDELFLSNYINTQIKDNILRIPGVGNLIIFGAKDFSMRIWLDPEMLKARDITAADVVDAIREQNVQVAAGQIGAPPAPDTQVFNYTVNTLGRLNSVEEFGNIIIKVGDGGRILRVKDVARIELGAFAYDNYVRLNGAPSIAMGIYQLPGANALAIAQAVKAKLDELAKSFPQDVEYEIPFDPTKFITVSIDEVVTTLFVAIVLVVLTVYIFLQDWRTTLIPSVTIPVSLIGTFAVMLAVGFSINTLSLFGLVLAIGIVVDDSIVVVENTMRLIDEEKLPPKKAAEKAMIQVTGPVIATTLVLLAVFVPTAMIPGITGRLYRQFALTISIATCFSSVNALTLSPALCGMLLRPSPKKRGLFFTAYNRMFDATTKGYMAGVKFMIRRVAIPLILFVVVLAATAYGFKVVPGGFVPDEDQGYLYVNAQLPDGASLNRAGKVLELVTPILREQTGVKDVISVCGYNLLDMQMVTNSCCFFVMLDDWDERKTPELQVDAIRAALQAKLASVQEAVCIAFAPPAITGLGMASGFEFQLQDRGGAGLVMLETVANDIIYKGRENPVLTRLSNNFRAASPQLFLDIDRTKAKMLNVPLSTVFSTLQSCLGSAYVNDFNLFGRTFKVMTQSDAEYRQKIANITSLEVRNEQGDMVPLSTILTVRDTAGPQTIYRYNVYSTAKVSGQPAKGYSSGQAIQAMEQIADEVMPPSMGYEWTGMTYQQIEAGNLAPLVFGLAFVFAYLFLAAQYESWSMPFAIMLTVGVALFGSIWFTHLRRFDNNIYTQIGLVLMIGLSAKTAILIAEFAMQSRSEGMSIFDSAVTAARLRFRPLLMTTVSCLLGFLPLVVAVGAGAESRKSLGTAVFGGTLTVTILGVFFAPMLYYVMQNISEKVFRKKIPGVTDLEQPEKSAEQEKTQ